jgi:hypothetical protein
VAISYKDVIAGNEVKQVSYMDVIASEAWQSHNLFDKQIFEK